MYPISRYSHAYGRKLGYDLSEYKNNVEIKQYLFADDASFPLQGTKRSFENLITTLEQFGKLSGLKLNMSKCTV